MRTIMIWLDDERNPLYFVHPRVYMLCDDVIWVKNYNEFISLYDKLKKEHILMISFDHDLGEEKTGYDCLKYVVNDCMNNNLNLPFIEVHTANPVGRYNMLSYLNSYKKSLEE